jgi:hypothetical protein
MLDPELPRGKAWDYDPPEPQLSSNPIMRRIQIVGWATPRPIVYALFPIFLLVGLPIAVVICFVRSFARVLRGIGGRGSYMGEDPVGSDGGGGGG